MARVISGLGASLVALFLVTSSASAMDGAENSKGEKPCLKIRAACKAAGFVEGGVKDGKGLHVNCMKPLMSGAAVSGVSVDTADVQKCVEHKGKAKKEHKGKAKK